MTNNGLRMSMTVSQNALSFLGRSIPISVIVLRCHLQGKEFDDIAVPVMQGLGNVLTRVCGFYDFLTTSVLIGPVQRYNKSDIYWSVDPFKGGQMPPLSVPDSTDACYLLRDTFSQCLGISPPSLMQGQLIIMRSPDRSKMAALLFSTPPKWNVSLGSPYIVVVLGMDYWGPWSVAISSRTQPDLKKVLRSTSPPKNPFRKDWSGVYERRPLWSEHRDVIPLRAVYVRFFEEDILPPHVYSVNIEVRDI